MMHFFYSVITLVISLFFITLGLLSILVKSSHNIRSEFISFILEDTIFLTLFGISLILIGILLVVYLMSGFKKRYVKIKSNNQPFYLDENLFQDYLKSYWKQLFPKHDIPNHVVVKKNKVLITADLPFVPEEQQKALLNRIDRDLKDIFTRLLGYQQEYVISISFQKKAPESITHA